MHVSNHGAQVIVNAARLVSQLCVNALCISHKRLANTQRTAPQKYDADASAEDDATENDADADASAEGTARDSNVETTHLNSR